MDEIRCNVTVWRSDKHEYLVRVIVGEGTGPLRPGYFVFHRDQSPTTVDADERKITGHNWPRASVNQVFYFDDWPRGDLTNSPIKTIRRII